MSDCHPLRRQGKAAVVLRAVSTSLLFQREPQTSPGVQVNVDSAHHPPGQVPTFEPIKVGECDELIGWTSYCPFLDLGPTGLLGWVIQGHVEEEVAGTSLVVQRLRLCLPMQGVPL